MHQPWNSVFLSLYATASLHWRSVHFTVSMGTDTVRASYFTSNSRASRERMWCELLCAISTWTKRKKKWLWMGFFFLLTRITGIQLSHSNQTEGLKITIISLRGWKLKNADEQHPLKLRALLSSPLWRSLTTSHQLDFSFRGVFAARRTACSSLDEAMLSRPVSRRHKIHMLFSLKRMYGQT